MVTKRKKTSTKNSAKENDKALDESMDDVEDLELDDVDAAVLFRIDGSVLKSAFNEKSCNQLIRVLQWCKDNVERVSREMKTNNLKKVTYELNETCVLFFVVNHAIILTTLANQNANLSLLSIEAKRKSSIISHYL